MLGGNESRELHFEEKEKIMQTLKVEWVRG